MDDEQKCCCEHKDNPDYKDNCLKQNNIRYSACHEEYAVFDWENGEIIKGMDIVVRLNRQNSILNQRTKELEAIRNQLKKEIDDSDGELKKALMRISNTELIY